MDNHSSWQQELQQAITDPVELFARLDLPQALLPEALQANNSFRLKVPRAFVAKMTPGDIKDPLLQQILPVGQELLKVAGFVHDPVQEQGCNPAPGLLHKYPSRVLWLLTGACAIHCRYCFRRHFPYETYQANRQQWDQALAYVASKAEIHEIILSGGDPLLAPDRLLAELVDKISAINHVQVVRIHTRLPAVLPSRFTEGLLNSLTHTRLKVMLVSHINHPQEIDAACVKAMQRLAAGGITLLNQSVLLKGINDTVSVLKSLSERLFFEAGILPYYLHLLDRVEGAAHLEVPLAKAQTLIEGLRGQVAGYLVPRLVQEVPGFTSKTVLG